MAVWAMERGPIRPRDDLSDDEDELSSNASLDSEVSESGSSVATFHESGSDMLEAQSQSSEASGTDNDDASPGDISFETLAKAQETFQPKQRKRKLPPEFQQPDSENYHQKANPDDQSSKSIEASKPLARQSKHAPTVSSSRQQVSRKREIFEPSNAPKSRDPRFDPTVLASNSQRTAVEKANKNYSFLTSYQAAEILELKALIKKTKDPHQVEELKRKVMSIESKLRSAAGKQREAEILKEHKQKEKAALSTGQKSKPFYLKKSQVKQQAEHDRLEGMGKRARDKAAARKRKREKTKDARHMPRVRRED